MPPPNPGMLFTAPSNEGRNMKSGIGDAVGTLCAFYRCHWRLMSVDLICRISKSLLQLLIPLVALRVFQIYLPAGDLSSTGSAALVFALLALASSVFEWGGTIAGQWLGFRIEAEMRERLFSHIQRLPFSYFDRTKTGEILSRITGDLRQVGTTSHLMPEAFVEIVLMLIGSFTVMFCLNVRMALFTLLPVPFILLFASSFQKRIHRVWRGNRKEAAAFAAHVENSVLGIREVKSFTCEDRQRRLFRHVNARFRRSFETMSTLYAPLNSGTQLMLEGYSLMYIALGAWMTVHDSLSVGMVFAFYMYSRYVTMPMMRVVNFLDMFQQGIVGVRRYLEVLSETPEDENSALLRLLADVRGEIVFEGLKFRYPEAAHDVLDIPSLTIPAGSVCAFVGPSGGGKSTIAALIARFYDPTEGIVRLDGEDTALISRKQLRSRIGMVAQRPFLFDGTIRENLLLGDASASDDKLMEALSNANLSDFVSSLPNGLDTSVGEQGVRISGGQAQRIAIGRVFLKNPPILILDEATSALDTFSETAVQDALRRLSSGRTTVVIAHRLSTIRHATLICYLENGRIVEAGTHDELLSRDGRYRALLKTSGRIDAHSS